MNLENDVIIIDCGVNNKEISRIFLKKPYLKIHNYKVENNNIIKSHGSENPNSHGTLCSAVFFEFTSCRNYIDIEIPTSKDYTMKFSDILTALKWCLHSEFNTKLILMSVGTLSKLETVELNKIVHQLYLKNILIVAACNNENIISYPASLPEVLGVRYDKLKLLPEGRFLYRDNPLDGIDVLTSGAQFNKLNKIIKTHNLSLDISNSFVTPYIAAIYNNTFPKTVFLEKRLNEMKKASLPEDYIQEDWNYFQKIIPISQEKKIVPIIGVKVSTVEELNFIDKLIRKFYNQGYITASTGNTTQHNILNLEMPFNSLLSVNENISYTALVTSADIVFVIFKDYNFIDDFSKSIDLWLTNTPCDLNDSTFYYNRDLDITILLEDIKRFFR